MDPNGQVVHRLGGVLPVEVPRRDSLPPLSQHDRVVRCAVHFRGDDAAHEIDGVVRDAVHLGRAAQRVGILNRATLLIFFFILHIVTEILQNLNNSNLQIENIFKLCTVFILL